MLVEDEKHSSEIFTFPSFFMPRNLCASVFITSKQICISKVNVIIWLLKLIIVFFLMIMVVLMAHKWLSISILVFN